ncbi:MAG: zinc metallopeptidase [Hyphomicrobiaceae bacterium]
MGVLMHLRTLPVEYDASFNRALPLLKEGGLIPAADLPAAREILRAAAFTYVASAATTLLNVGRWFRAFRF